MTSYLKRMTRCEKVSQYQLLLKTYYYEMGHYY